MLVSNTIKPADTSRHIFRTIAENRDTVHLDKVVVLVKIPTPAEGEPANAMTSKTVKSFEKARLSSGKSLAPSRS